MSSHATTTSPATSLRSDAKLIGLVGLAHAISHFSQLILAPLFPWLKDAFNVSYTELGAVLTVFFVVSCIVQAASGFIVDKLGPRPVLFVGLGALGLAAFGYAMAQRTGAWRWRRRACVAVAWCCWCCVQPQRAAADVAPCTRPRGRASRRRSAASSISCASRPCGCASRFFFFYAAVLSVVQAFAPEAARHLHRAGGAGGGVPDGLHGVQRGRHGGGRLPGLRPVALRAHRGRGLRHRGA
jgi:MFS family permease